MQLTRILRVPESLEMASRTDPGWDLLAGFLLGLAAAALLWLAYRYISKKSARATSRGNLRSKEGDIDARLRQVDHHLQELILRVDQMQLRGAGGSDFGQAIRLVQAGASTGQLIERCGMTRGEAELFRRLHTPPVSPQ